jgi:hypothetical protein
LLLYVSVCWNITAAAVAISFQPKKVEPKPVFFFLKFRICRPRQDGRCTCLSNENLKWTELNWNRTTSFLLFYYKSGKHFVWLYIV